MTRPALLTLAACLTALGSVVPARAQSRSLTAQQLYEDALRASRSGDTTFAIAALRRALERNADHPAAVFELGRLLARTAPTAERDFAQRAEAEDLLDRAFQLNDGDPSVLLEIGLLKRKQNIRVDAKRLLESVVDPGRNGALDPEAAAEAHYEIARILEEELFDYQHLVFLPPSRRDFGDASADPLASSPTARAGCPPGIALFCYNYTRSRDFNLLFEEVASPASDRADEHLPRIEAHYRTALSLDPLHRMAARGLMALYLREQRLEDFRRTADDLTALDPNRPYPHLFRGLALYHLEQWQEALDAFELGLGLMEAHERVAYEDVDALLTGNQRLAYASLADDQRRAYEEVLWAKSDPLYLVPGNERRLEHLSRVAYAELNFGDPALGLRGWESDRGLVYIRYGPPRKIWKIDTSTRLTSAAGGRWILWNYRLDAPSFIFFSQPGYRSVRFDQSANTQAYVEELAEIESPSVFRSRAVATWIDLPYQLARFRGTDPALTQVAAFVEADPSRFLLFSGDSVTAALFLFTPQHGDSAELRRTLPATASGSLVFTTELYPAAYEFAIEALARESRVGGTERGSLAVPGFPTGVLSLSDLVVADGVQPRVVDPGRWTDFSIAASRDLAFDPTEAIHLYFEVYGLEVDGSGEAEYEIELRVEDTMQQGFVSSVVRSLGNLVGLGEDADTRVRFDRRARPRDGVVPEYLSMALADAEPGSYRIRVRVRDRESGQEDEVTREIVIRD